MMGWRAALRVPSQEPAKKTSVYESAMPADGAYAAPFASNEDVGTPRIQEQLFYNLRDLRRLIKTHHCLRKGRCVARSAIAFCVALDVACLDAFQT
jgi:hypothetical protein